MLEITFGEKQRAKVGAVLQVYRPQTRLEYLGKVKIVRVNGRVSTGTFLGGSSITIQSGDIVTSAGAN